MQAQKKILSNNNIYIYIYIYISDQVNLLLDHLPLTTHLTVTSQTQDPSQLSFLTILCKLTLRNINLKILMHVKQTVLLTGWCMCICMYIGASIQSTLLVTLWNFSGYFSHLLQLLQRLQYGFTGTYMHCKTLYPTQLPFIKHLPTSKFIVNSVFSQQLTLI